MGLRAVNSIDFIIPYAAVGKGRPNAVRTTRSVRMVTPEGTRAFEDRVKQVAAIAMRGREPLTGPLYLELMISVHPAPEKPPEHLIGLDGVVYPARKPDLDNTEKAIADALNGIVWKDDCQVCRVNKDKIYGDSAYILVKVMRL